METPVKAPSFVGKHPGSVLVAIKIPLIFKRWAARLGFIKGYEAPHQVTCLGEYNKMVFAASGNMVFLLCHDGVFRPMRFEVLNDKD